MTVVGSPIRQADEVESQENDRVLTFKTERVAVQVSCRRSRCAPSTAAVGADGRDERLRSEQPDDPTVVAVEDRRRLRRLPHLRCFATSLRLCGSSDAMCDGCDDFVCDVFVSSCLRGCDACDGSKMRCLCASLYLCASVVQTRHCNEP